MSEHATDFSGNVGAAIKSAITTKIPDARVEVKGGGGHYSIEVSSAEFSGKSLLASQRIVYAAITHLMTGERPPVHAVDRLVTKSA